MCVRLVCCALGLSAAACLSSPDAATIDAGDQPMSDARAGDATSGDAAGGADAMPTICGARDDFTAMAFPPMDMNIGIRHITAADLNLDGAVDLVLTNADVPDDDFGVFVLLGPQSDTSNLVYHAFVPTGAAPHALAVHDVMGEPCPEVTIYGRAKMVATGYAEIYNNVGAPSLLDPVPVRKDVGYQPSNDDAPVHAVYAALESDSLQNDLVVGDLGNMIVMLTEGTDFATEIVTSTPTFVGPDGTPQETWGSINRILPRRSPTTPAVDDLLVIELNTYTWMVNDGSGGFGSMPVTLDNNFDFSAFGVLEYDYDESDPIDVIGGGGTRFGGYLVSQTDAVVAPTSARWWGTMPSTDGVMDDILIADLDGNTLPEVIMIDYDETAGSAVHMVDSTYYEPKTTEFLPITVHSHNVVGADPRNGAIADFSGGGSPEVWVFDPNGAARCLERDPTPGIRLCQ